MTGVSQFESHPDAELLAAFAEQALGGQEHADVLAHLGLCDRCRQIVFLATDAALAEAALDSTAEPAAPASAAPVKLPRRRFAWLSDWRLAWMPATALALVVLTAVLIRIHRGNPSDTARIETPPAPAVVVSNTASSTAQNPPAATPKTPVQQTAKISPPGARSPEAAPPTAPVVETKSIPPYLAPAGQPATANQPAQFPTRSMWMEPAPQPRAAAAVDKGAVPPAQAATNSSLLPAADSSSPAAYAAYATRIGSGVTFDRDASAGLQNHSPELAAARRASATRLEARKFTLASVNPESLPNGAAPISLARGATRTLALDKTGSLYLSLDQGVSWKTVPAQWTGRAIAVRLRGNLLSGSSTASPNTMKAARAQAATEAQPNSAIASELFEISNDQGQSWTSTDGFNWTALQ
jgi:hypothetical protein